MKTPRWKQWLKNRGPRATYFLVAVFLHLVVLLAIAGWIIIPRPAAQPPDLVVVIVPHHEDAAPPPPTNPDVSLSKSDASVPTPQPFANPASDLHLKIVPPKIGDFVPGGLAQSGPPRVPTPPGPGNPDRHGKILHTLTHWFPEDELKHPSKGPEVTAHFPLYLAKYAHGDWDCNNYFHGGDMTSGALPNLIAKLTEWSHGRLTILPPKAIDLASRELLDNPPPFLFFTGHSDFRLTDAEIENLQKYLQLGGAIWGDAAFAGDGSRFDVAFHREMKRVLPDEDKNFEPLPADHPIFTEGKFRMDAAPAGMNYRHDPIEVINLDGKLAVIYTPNDYSDLMTLHLADGSDNESAQMGGGYYWKAEAPLTTNGIWYDNSATYYRNYVPPSAMQADKLGMNIVVHLLTRFQDELQLGH